ncbi:hypothetical protein FGKAn22_12640 [Ferrigenium kumadai]|uniref:Filamentous haemagglutinin FhaB/tRNA nuclease CdiA-like TPS domain-containing protein n=1 Tax=Ferrigenium kumadai TaxID=1682490 RepID=A0AAN1SZM2_9PROT|nr:MBG domain-containing protein [Ferrigenium kumadai]BBI99571.1 hypothetical protein FGKAn22_12640 [Ferrigenium kumadai]
MSFSKATKQVRFKLNPLCAAVLFACAAQSSYANPLGPSVVNGQANFAITGTTLTVTNTPGTIINWQAFSIGANEVTRFAQQSAASTVLNRVTGGVSSSILGTLQSNGRVFLVNPNGIVFGAGATIDVAGLVATTLNLSNADFLSGRYHFTQMPGAQNISNAGNITAQSGGQIYLIAPNVENTGVITAPNGDILLAAGHEVELVNSLDPNLRVNIIAPAGDATNVGKLMAEAGSLGLFGTVVRNSGTVSADSAVMQGGKIVFKASHRAEVGGAVSASGSSGGSVDIGAAHSSDPNAPGVVIHTGSITANGTTGAGGAVGMRADSILSSSSIHADGTNAGGKISVQAAGRALSTSSARYTANSSLGQGGDVLVSANVSNYTSGSYSATGVTGGNLTIAGSEIKLAGAQLDASGTNGGGNIHVGGLMHGGAGFGAQGISLANATNVLANGSTSFKADAQQSGNGGEIVLWSDQAMRFTGNISAKGGSTRGNGGMAEVSGLASLAYGGLTDLSATNGLNGTLLLDPRNITIMPGNGALSALPYQEIIDPAPGAGEGFGGMQNLVLASGNILVSSPLDSFTALNSGAVYLYNPGGTLISALAGSVVGDKVGALTQTAWGITSDNNGVTALANGNVIVGSNNWSGTRGAVTWMNGTTGALSDGTIGGAVSAANSLLGSTAGDKVGESVMELGNSKVLVTTLTWNNGGVAANAGAVTWMDGATGKLSDTTTGGAISTTNSLVGSTAGDQIGSGGIALVTDNLNYWNFVIRSPLWGSGGTAANALGAVTWMNGVTGELSNSTVGTPVYGGVVSAANSLVGSTAGDKVGTMTLTSNYGWGPTTGEYSGIVVRNGNLVVSSNNWNNGGAAAGAGAVTWMNGATGALSNGALGGAVSSANSLVGSAAGDRVGMVTTHPWSGWTADRRGLDWLPNGNFLVGSGEWGGGMGAVTWVNGTLGISGVVSSANSIVGSAAGDMVGVGWNDLYTADPGLVILPNGNYVVVSSRWGGGKGAVTWGNGSTGTSGVVTGAAAASAGIAPSLVGAVGASYVGAQGIAVQAGGSNYLVKSPWFDFNTLIDSGAVTWMNGATGALTSGVFGGAVDGTNSLMGGFAYDNVGAVTLLNNGNFLATTPVWSGGSPSTGLGAVTWISGATGKLADLSNGGAISNINSLVGSTGGDMSGNGIIQLANGNILVRNPNWDNGANVNVGALTWMKGATGELSNSTVGVPVYGGVIGTANSLVGAYGGVWNGISYAGSEHVGNTVTTLSTGNVLVQTPTWHNPTTNADYAGAVTWVNGATGKLVDGSAGGTISALNSLVGDVANSSVGFYAITQLGNGKVVIASPSWSNGAATGAGAVTWMNGATGALSDGSFSGSITSANSLIGATANDSVGMGVTLASDGTTFWNYVVHSNWNGVGALTWMDGATGKTSDTLGISAANSLVGSAAGDAVGNSWMQQLGNGMVLFTDTSWGSNKGAVTWMNPANGLLANGTAGGIVSATNSLVGSTSMDSVGSGGITEITDGATFWNYAVSSPNWANGAVTGAGAVTLGNGVTGTAGTVSASNSLVGSATSDSVGSGGITLVSNGISFWNYIVSSPAWGGAGGAGKGAVTWVNGQTGRLSNGALGGTVDSTNSLLGSVAGDWVGVAPAPSWSSALTGVNAFGNGNVLIRSEQWGGGISAFSWMNGATGALAGGATGGVVSATNSLLGSTVGDNLGNGVVGLTQLQVNGNWVITSPDWGSAGGWNGGKGAATWMNSATGQLADGSFGGVVSATNSLVGSVAGDVVGGDWACDCAYSGGITALSDGHYVVHSLNFGAVSWGNGTTGLVGLVTARNSVFGTFGNVSELTSQPGKVLLGSKTANGGAGGVYLFGTPAAVGPLFGNSPGVDATIGAGWIAGTLNLGTNVVLQANNDITQEVGAGITATGSGNLTLQAGRSVMLNDAIDIAGALNITANDAGAVAANRTAGNAVIDTTLATITAGLINLANSGGDILAGTLAAATGGINLNASGNVVLNGALVAASGNNIVLAASGNFDNRAGTGALGVSGGGRWLVYSTAPALDVRGGLVYDFKQYNTTYGGTVLGSGNGFVYSLAPVINVTLGGNVSKVYDGLLGAALSAANFTAANAVDGDTITLNGVGSYDTRNVGNAKAVNVSSVAIAGASNGFAPVYGYQLGAVTGTALGTITPATISAVTGITAANKVYDGTAGATLNTAAAGFTGMIAGDLLSVTGATGAFIDKNAAISKTVTISGIALAGIDAGNYTLGSTSASTVADITPASLTVTANVLNKTYGAADPALGYVATGVIGTDTLTGAQTRAAGENVGTYAISQGTLTNPNYTIAYTGSSLGITPAALTVSANATGKLEGGVDPLLTYMVAGLKFTDTAATTLSGALSRVAGETAGTYPISQGTLALLSTNYTMSYVPANFTITAPVLATPTVINSLTSTVSVIPAPQMFAGVIATATVAAADTATGNEQKQEALQTIEAANSAAQPQAPKPLPVCQ